MILALVYPIMLGLDRLETAALLRGNGTFQYLTGLPSYPDPQSLRRFLLQAPPDFREQLHRLNDWLLGHFIHRPEHRSRLILDLDSTVVTVFGRQEGAEVGYNPRYRGKRSYDPLLCLEANSAFLWDTELRPGNAGTWDSSPELLAGCFLSLPADIRELRVRADAGFGFDPVLAMLEQRRAQYAVVARMASGLRRKLDGLRYERLNPRWEIGEWEYRAQGWLQARRCIVARRRIEETEPEPTLFTLQRYAYRAWLTNLPLTPAGVWHFYDGRAGCALFGSRAFSLQLSDCFPADLSAGNLARSDLKQIAAQATVAAGRTHSASEPTHAETGRNTRQQDHDRNHLTPSP